MNRAERRRQQKALKKGKGISISVSSDNVSEIMRKGVALHHQGELAQAETIYKQVLQAFPEQPQALNSMAMIHHAKGDYDKAVVMLEKAIAIGGGHVAGEYHNLARVHEAAGDYHHAMAAYARCLELDPSHTEAARDRGVCLMRMQDPVAAAKQFKALFSDNPRDFFAVSYYAHALVAQGDDTGGGLLDFDRFIRPCEFDVDADLNADLVAHIRGHSSLQREARATRHGAHTGELLDPAEGPMIQLEAMIREAVACYLEAMPDAPGHPFLGCKPKQWELTSWGLIMENRGHEISHIHPNGWMSGVFYVALPDVVEDPDADEQGWIEFGRPPEHLPLPPIAAPPRLKPQVGQMFLFPSYAWHGTIPFRSKQRRVSVSFDVLPLD